MRRFFAGLLIVLAALGASAAAVQARDADTWADALVHVDAAHALGYTGQGVTVAVVDTGIDDHLAALAGTVVGEHCIVPPHGCPGGTAESDGPGSAQDDQGHGTEVAGVLADVAPGAKLVVVKVADRNGRSSSAQIQAGLDWVRIHHPEARIVNVSLAGDVPLSGDCSKLTPSLASYAASVDALRAQGTLVFAASGNNGAANGIPAPGCFPETVAVGAVYARDFGAFTAPNICRDTATQADEVACWSNASSELDLLAAGAPVDTVGLGGAPVNFAGTSAAAAQAAGAAALLLQADPRLTADALESLMEQTGVPIVDLRRRSSTPRIDLAAALAVVLGHPVPVLPAPTSPRVGVSATNVAFGTVRRPSVRRLALTNSGNGPLEVRVGPLPPWLDAVPAQVALSPGAHAVIQLRFRPSRRGGYRGRFALATDDPTQPSVRIAVSGRFRPEASQGRSS